MVRVRSRVRVHYTDYPPLEELDALVEQMRQSQKQEEDKVLRRYQLIRKLLGLRQMAGVCSMFYLINSAQSKSLFNISSPQLCLTQRGIAELHAPFAPFPRRPQETETPPSAREGYLSFLSFYKSMLRTARHRSTTSSNPVQCNLRRCIAPSPLGPAQGVSRCIGIDC